VLNKVVVVCMWHPIYFVVMIHFFWHALKKAERTRWYKKEKYLKSIDNDAPSKKKECAETNFPHALPPRRGMHAGNLCPAG